MATTPLIEKGNPGYSKQQMQLRQAATVPTTPTPVQTNMPVSADSAARGVVGYGAGGAALYNQGAAPANVIGTQKPVTTASPITISNKNKNNQVSEMNNTLAGYSANRGMTSDGETMRYPDGSVYQEPKKVNESDIESAYKSSPEFQLLEQMRQSLDANTASQIAGIQQQLEQRRMETNEFSQNQSRAAERSRLMSGQAQAAPTSVGSLMNAQEKYRVKQIAALDTEEQRLISAAKEAQQSGNYQLLAKQIGIIQGIREQKQKEVAEVNKSIAEQNKKLQERAFAVQQENAVADLYQSGITDVASIMDSLAEQGVRMTSKEINETIKNLVPPGLDDLAKTLRANGAPAAVVRKVMNSQDINDAYEAAGSYAAGGTGIVGEYNKYKADSEYAGVPYLSFDEYQTRDANRKVSIARAGAPRVDYGGYDKEQQKAIDQINTAIANNPAYKKSVSMQTYADNVANGLAAKSGIGDIAAINQFQKVIDEGAVTRDADVTLLQSSQSLAGVLQTKINKLQKGEQLSEAQRQQMLTLTQKMLADQQKALAKDPSLLAQKQKAERYKIDPSETILGGFQEQETTASQAIKEQLGAKEKVINIAKQKPELNDVIYKKLSTVDKTLKRALTYDEVLQYLQATGKIN